MSLDTYANLQTSLTSWLGNSLNAALYPDFIALFEAAANRRLRVRQQEATTTLTPSSGSVALPTDYLSWRRATVTASSRVEMDYVEASYLQALYPSIISTVPQCFAIEGANLLTRSSDATGIEFVYFQKIAALSAGVNWLLTAHPDLYLFGSLVEAEMFGVNDERAPLWKARRDEIFDEIEKLSNKSRGAGAMRVMGAHP